MGQTLANGQTHQTDTAYVNNVYWKRMSTIRTIIPPYFDEQVQVEIKEVLGNSKTPLALGKYNFYQDYYFQNFWRIWVAFRASTNRIIKYLVRE